MQTTFFLGFALWQWLLIVLVCWTAFVLVRRASGARRKRDDAERLARRAEVSHEGATTRHEGGA